MNNLNDEQVLTVENKYWADMWLALSRLKENKDFKHVILEGYFKDKAVNGVSLLARDAVVQGGHRTAVMEDLIAISSLEDFFITIENLGSNPPLDDED
jgi:hypothetical protein